MTDDVRKLLGGYASNTLTEEERAQLFQAALPDHQPFEALADEQALKDLLDDPSARAALLDAVQPRRQPKPWRWLLPAGAAFAALVVAVVSINLFRPNQPPVQQLAKVRSYEAHPTQPSTPLPERPPIP